MSGEQMVMVICGLMVLGMGLAVLGMIGLIILQNWQWGRERRDLCLRIQCRDAGQYVGARAGLRIVESDGSDVSDKSEETDPDEEEETDEALERFMRPEMRLVSTEEMAQAQATMGKLMGQ